MKILPTLMIGAFVGVWCYAQHDDYLTACVERDAAIARAERIARDYAAVKKAMWGAGPTNEASATLAIQNNNPLNVKRVAGKWQGQQGVDAQGHIIFDSPENGVRAAANVLLNYYHSHGLDTAYGIVDRFCTADKPRKKKYAAFIEKRLGIAAGKSFPVLERMPDLLAAMARFESGKEWDASLFAPYSLLHAAYTKGGE